LERVKEMIEELVLAPCGGGISPYFMLIIIAVLGIIFFV